MDDVTLLRRMARSTRLVTEIHGEGSEGARVLELEDGAVNALITPVAPDRSVLNAVDYHDVRALEAALPTLVEEYAQAGINRWTVWVPEPDAATAKLLESEGHTLDAAPRAMGAPIADCDLGDGAAGLDVSTERDAPLVGLLNERAYGYDEGSFAAGFETFDERMYVYVARIDGEPVSTVSCSDLEGDCGVWWVATLPDARGKSLSKALLQQALIDARERGCDSTTLQASDMGYPIYERIGYRDLGGLQMWERRPL